MFSIDDDSIKRYFSKRKVRANIRYRRVNGRRMRWVETFGQCGPEGKKVMFFLHGAPGSSRDFFRYLADPGLGSHAVLVSVDRPGYGLSEPDTPEPSIAEQARLLGGILDTYARSSVYLVGHSYGGPIAAKLALLRPDSTRGVFLIAPVIDPVSEPYFWISSIGRWPILRKLLPQAVINATEEKLAHREALRELLPEWRELRVPVWHWHGRWDILAPPANIEFCRRQISEQYLDVEYKPWAGHLLPWTHYRQLRAAMVRILDPTTTVATKPPQGVRNDIYIEKAVEPTGKGRPDRT